PSIFHSPFTQTTFMFKHHILISYRSALRNKSTFLINLIGLSTGLATALLIFLWVQDEWIIDKIPQGQKAIYQVMQNLNSNSGEIYTSSNQSTLLAPSLKAEIPEIAYVTPLRTLSLATYLSIEDQSIKAQGAFAGKNFFKVFPYRLIEGNKQNILTDPSSIVLSIDLAEKIFGSSKAALNQTLKVNHNEVSGDFMVSGVFNPTSIKASEEFEFFLSHDYFLSTMEADQMHWANFPSEVYLTFRQKSIDLPTFNRKIEDFSRDKFLALGNSEENLDWVGKLFIRDFSHKYLYNRYENGTQAGGRIEYVKSFVLIGIFILFMACINFMNLSTAQSGRRAKEMGVKKVVGAQRKTLIAQHFFESLFNSLLALLLSFIWVVAVLPGVNDLTDKNLSMGLGYPLFFSSLALILATGLLAGSYPALYLSKIKPLVVLKGSNPHSIRELWTRKGLVIFQFVLALLFIGSVYVMHNQFKLITTKNLGYEREHVILFERQGQLMDSTDLETFVRESRKIPGVNFASIIGGNPVDMEGATGGYEVKGEKGTVKLSNESFGYDGLKTLGIELKEGRDFSRAYSNEENKVILNETAVKLFELKKSLGKRITVWGDEWEVIGVVYDFHFQPLYEQIKPLVFFFEPDDTEQIIVNLSPKNLRNTLKQMESLHSNYNSGYPFEYEFLDQSYNDLYQSESRTYTLYTYFSAISLLISCLGLWGLAAYTAERREKEMGVRKVLGAKFKDLILLLSKDFTQMVLWAIVMATPLGYLIAQKWLENFAYRIPLHAGYFVLAGVSVLLLTWLTVSLHTVRAARTNPVESLKRE
ncbi:MAG: ABC transporter permease, partial [Bacteroidota bacterium]